MTKQKYDFEKYLSRSEKFKQFLDSYKTKPSTYRAYRMHLVRYFEKMGIKDVDKYVKDTRQMNKKQKIEYLDGIEQDLKKYWQTLNEETKGKTPYLWLSAMKMFLMMNKTFELDDVFMTLQKNGHGNYAVTNTNTPTKEEILKIFSYSNPESKALFLFQLTSGQRIEQVLETTFDNIDMTMEFPRIFYPKSKTKNWIKTRITPEAKKALEDYLAQRKKFIDIRIKRGEHCRKKELDMNKLFPMDNGTANAIWSTMVKNAGLYKLDPDTKRPTLGTHCLRRYFLSHFSDREWGDFFSGHVTPRNREYRQYSDEKLDSEYMNYIEDLNIFDTTSKNIDDLNERMKEKDNESSKMQKRIEDLETLTEMLKMKLDIETLKNGKQKK